MRSKQKRPIGVTLVALVFLWIGGGGSLLLPIIGLTGGTFAMWRIAFGSTIHSEVWLRAIAHSLDCLWFLLYVAYAVIGFGLWKLKNWARKGLLVVAMLGMGVGLVVSLTAVRPIALAISVLGIALAQCGWLAWYLMRPRVRYAFGDWNPFSATGEPVEPPRLSNQRRVAVGILAAVSVLVLFIVPLFFGIGSMMRKSGAYQLTMSTVQSSPCVIRALGSPLESGLMMTGSIEESSGEGFAQLNIPVKGPNGKGNLDVEAKKRNGSWKIDSLVFIHGTTQTKIVPSQAGLGCQ